MKNFLLLVACLLFLASYKGNAQKNVTKFSENYYDALEWRNIGPFRGGRSATVTGVPGKANLFYMGSTGGGVWKTTDAGNTWENISDGFFDKESLITKLSSIELTFVKNSETQKNEVCLNGENVEKYIRTLEVSSFVSPVATISQVRAKLVEQQQYMGEAKGVVMDGRDIGTVVFPTAELKIFMTASAEERAKRRYQELLDRGDEVQYKAVLANVIERDEIDTTRKDSPLVKASDAIEIDNTETSVVDQFYAILQLAKDRIAGRV